MSLQLRNVKKSYPNPEGGTVQVLDIPQFDLEKGDQVVLLGSSGGGKTTLLNVIAGITTPDSGQVVIEGTDLTRLPEVARDRFRALKIGIIFQAFHLLPAMTALENVLLGMSFSGQTADKKFAMELLTQLGLSERLHYKPSQLSIGQQQRVAIARALANKPALLLADEPTASVDMQNARVVIDLLKSACKEHDVSLLLVSHSEQVAEEFDRSIRLEEINVANQDAEISSP